MLLFLQELHGLRVHLRFPLLATDEVVDLFPNWTAEDTQAPSREDQGVGVSASGGSDGSDECRYSTLACEVPGRQPSKGVAGPSGLIPLELISYRMKDGYA